MTPATTIDEVIVQLEQIIGDCIKNKDRSGYFAMLYCNVTRRVKQGIGNHEFSDNGFVEKLDVLFANHYIRAWPQWQHGLQPSESWATAFKAAIAAPLIVLQHYLLGMNAHINLDLGIATAEALQGKELKSIKKDFDAINMLLGSMIDATKTCLERINPLMYLLRLHRKNYDDLLVNFSIGKARAGAWCFAESLTNQTGSNYDNCIADRDKLIAQLGHNIAYPQSNLLNSSLKMIHRFEGSDIAANIRHLKILT
ncbi:DUF5995 family protein [Niabella aquatica]